jgi:ribosome-binding factor A
VRNGIKSDDKGGSRRVAKAEGEVLRLVAEYLIRHQRGELPALVSATRVIMSADLRTAKVFVSALGDDVKPENILKTLKSWAPEVQHYISDKLPMRYCPKVQFHWDETTSKVLKIDAILHEIASKKESST